MNPDIQEIIDHFGLEPLPEEGGWYRETYRSDGQIARAALPDRYGGPRCFSTAILYLITAENYSRLHKVKSDEIFHFHMGDPVEMLTLGPDGSGEIYKIGSDWRAGQRPQICVPAGVWQGCRLVEGGEYALLGCTVAPGFEFDDYTDGNAEQLKQEYPKFVNRINRLA